MEQQEAEKLTTKLQDLTKINEELLVLNESLLNQINSRDELVFVASKIAGSIYAGRQLDYKYLQPDKLIATAINVAKELIQKCNQEIIKPSALTKLEPTSPEA